MKRIGIFGGSFNPIHNGHLGLASAFVARRWVDEVWLMVSPQNPLKQHAGLMDENVRLELARLAVEGVSGVQASDFEFHLPRPSYTWRTLAALEETYRDDVFVLIMGADNWQIFPQWKKAADLLRRYEIIVYPRPGIAVDASSLPEHVRLFDAPLFPWSSTEIRQRLHAGLPIDGMVPEAVARVIGERHLYE